MVCFAVRPYQSKLYCVGKVRGSSLDPNNGDRDGDFLILAKQEGPDMRYYCAVRIYCIYNYHKVSIYSRGYY